MLNLIFNAVGGAIAKGAVEVIKDYQKQLQVEQMQAEILEGWSYKILDSLELACKMQGIEYDKFSKIREKVEETIKEEFDNRRI